LRVLIEYDGIQFVDAQSSSVERAANGESRKTGVVFYATQTFFLNGETDLTTLDEGGRRVVVVARKTENGHCVYGSASTQPTRAFRIRRSNANGARSQKIKTSRIRVDTGAVIS
jgi:hypothetical protein